MLYLVAVNNLFSSFQVLFLPMIVFVPSITFNQVTGFNAMAISSILVCVCVFYTLVVSFLTLVCFDRELFS